MRRRPLAAIAATAASMFGAACFIPRLTSYSPGACASSACCNAARCASVRAASGLVPPSASYRAVSAASASGVGGFPRRMSV